jgi:hypothetical protein
MKAKFERRPAIKEKKRLRNTSDDIWEAFLNWMKEQELKRTDPNSTQNIIEAVKQRNKI